MNTLIKAIEILGIIAFAITGIHAARRKRMDLVGTYTVAMITAFGGGSLRDIILDRRPLFWIEHYEYAILLLLLSIIVGPFIEVLFSKKSATDAVMSLDALGLGSFCASGTSLAHQLGCHPFVAVLLGVTTGVFGGVLRDIICNEIPTVFQRTELYATCAVAGSICYLAVLQGFGSDIVAVATCVAVTLVMRMLSLRYHIRLPM